MKRITREELVHAMSPENPAVEGVEPGEEIIFETAGPSSATGPVAVLGAEPGDTLMVEVLEIAGWKAGDEKPAGGQPGAGPLDAAPLLVDFIGVSPAQGETPIIPLHSPLGVGDCTSLPVHVQGANLAVGTPVAAVVRVKTALAKSFS